MNSVFAQLSTSITELKRNPNKVLQDADGGAVVVLSHNKPMAYLIPAATYEALMEQLDDAGIARLIKERMGEKNKAVKVSLHEL